MGRGRARAKQAKVARELKYHTPSTDLRSLQQELQSFTDSPATVAQSITAPSLEEARDGGGTDGPPEGQQSS
ncbi:DUF3073 domain-containing protein [Streptomyces sp. G5(2025)]|uniref:DUF3073 domain-containing protein n=1 Tax=Streptomyces sp. G5(2025) TaxID=3406628 RepID=UPI003C2498E8